MGERSTFMHVSINWNNLCGERFDKISIKMSKYDIAILVLEILPTYITAHNIFQRYSLKRSL